MKTGFYLIYVSNKLELFCCKFCAFYYFLSSFNMLSPSMVDVLEGSIIEVVSLIKLIWLFDEINEFV